MFLTTSSQYRKKTVSSILSRHTVCRNRVRNVNVIIQQLDCALSYTITDYHERKAALQKIVAEQQPPKSLVKRLTCDKQ